MREHLFESIEDPILRNLMKNRLGESQSPPSAIVGKTFSTVTDIDHALDKINYCIVDTDSRSFITVKSQSSSDKKKYEYLLIRQNGSYLVKEY